MPIYMHVDRIEHIVTMVAHGTVSDQEVRDLSQELIDANVPEFGKIIDTSAAVSHLTEDQIEFAAEILRKAPGYDRRGPVAYVINPDRVGFAIKFAEASQKDRPVRLFRSLREARTWIEEVTTPGYGLD